MITIISKLYNILEKFYTENYNWKKKLLVFIFAPISYILELLIRQYYWNKIILTEILTNDNIVIFLDEHGFEFLGNKFYKIDLLSSNEFYDRANIKEANTIIRKEYSLALYNLIKTECVFDIEDYLKLHTDIEIKYVKTPDGSLIKDRVYIVEFYFVRDYFLKKTRILAYTWIAIFILIAVAIQYIK